MVVVLVVNFKVGVINIIFIAIIFITIIIISIITYITIITLVSSRDTSFHLDNSIRLFYIHSGLLCPPPFQCLHHHVCLFFVLHLFVCFSVCFFVFDRVCLFTAHPPKPISLSLEETIKLHWSVYVLLSAATPWLLKVLLITTSLLPDFIMRSVNDTIIFTKKIVPKNKDGGCLVSASKGGCYNNKAFCDL